jgi:succinoglycan biosynthesis transport protein ExoP
MSEVTSQIDIREYLSVLNKRKVYIIIPIMIIPLVAFAIGFFIPPVYHSSVTLLIGESKVLPPSVERQLEAGRPISRESITERQQAIYSQITSTEYLRRLIAILDIPFPQEIRTMAAKAKSAYPEISENDLAETILADKLRGDVEVELSAANLLKIGVSAPNPIQAQRRAKTLADIFIEESLAKELAGIESNIAFSEDQLNFYHEKLVAAENKLKDFRQQLIVSNVEEDTSGLDLQQIAAAAEAIEFEISSLEERQRDYRGLLLAEDINVGSINFPSELSSEKEKLLSNIEKLTDLLTRYSWRDPRILSLNEEAKGTLTDLNRKITDYVEENYSDKPERVRETIAKFLIGELSIEFNRAKKRTLDNGIVAIKSRLTDNPDSEITLDRLQSEVDNYKALYDLFVKHSQFAAIDQSARKVEAEAKFALIKPASMPLGPRSPDKKKLLAMGLAIGLVFGTGIIILIEILDNSFKKLDELESYTGLKILGTIPRINLPYGSRMKGKIPYIIGAGVSFMLVILILFLRSKGN